VRGTSNIPKERGCEKIRKLRYALLLTVLAVSVFASSGFIKPAQATIGTHTIMANYYKAFIYDDHETWIFGDGDWYFAIRSPIEDYTYTGEIKCGDGEWGHFNISRTWTVSGSLDTWFRVKAEEHDSPTVDWSSTWTVDIPIPSPVNEWIEGHSERYRDVDHYYKYKIFNDAPTAEPFPLVEGTRNKHITVGDSVHFTAPIVTDAEGDSIEGYHWDFDDGGTSTEKNPTHRFSTVGRFNVEFKAKDYFDAWSEPQSLYVYVSPIFEATVDEETYEIPTRSDCYPVEDFSYSAEEKSITFRATFPVKMTKLLGFRIEGWVEVTIPKDFLGLQNPADWWVITIGGTAPKTLTVTETPTETTLYMTYIGKTGTFLLLPETKTVTIEGTWIVPEFPTAILMPLLMIATLAAAILVNRAQSAKTKR